MRRRRHKFGIIAACFAIGAILPFTTLAQPDLGEVRLENSGSFEAQDSFHRGLAALHSFWYSESREEFRNAQNIDKDFALAYWGEALTYDFPFGTNPDVDSARAVLNRLGPTPEARLRKAKTGIEKKLIQAVDALYGAGDRPDREEAYYKIMKELYESNEDNVEIASFYALSVLGKVVLGRDLREKVEAVAILEPFFVKNPNHPGVLHYTIHAYDDAILAPLGLRAARRYASVAPASSHALHMPSHIFLQLGMWEETTASNIDAYQTSIKTSEKNGRGVASYDTHALSWLVYSLQMQGAYAKAREMLDELKDIYDSGDGADNSLVYVLEAARYAMETEDWSATPSVKVADNFNIASVKANILHAVALKEIAERNYSEARATIEKIKALLLREDVVNNQNRIIIIKASQLMAEAALAEAEGNFEKALFAAREAALLETERALPIGPANPIKPANEYYGELLLKTGDAPGAMSAFKAALSRSAKRPPALYGLLKASIAAGDAELAASAHNDLKLIWENADADFKPAKELNKIK